MAARFTQAQRSLLVRAVVCAALVALGIALALTVRLPSHLMVDTGPGAYAAGAITSQHSLLQQLDLAGPMRVTSVDVLLATWGSPTNMTHDRLTVFDGEGHVVGVHDLPPGTVHDNTYVEVRLGPAISVPAHGGVSVAVTSADGSTKSSITAWATQATVAGQLYRVTSESAASAAVSTSGSQRLPDALCVRVSGLGPRGLAIESAARVALLLLSLAVAALVWTSPRLRRWWMARRPARANEEDVRPVVSWRSRVTVERAYLIVALVWGLILVFLTPPLQTFDELAHYYRSWSVAQGQIAVPHSGRVRLPAGAESLTQTFPTGPLAFRLMKVSLGSLEAGMRIPMGSRWVTASSTASGYGPVGYFPQALGIDIVRTLRGPPLAAMYLARLLTLITAVLLTYLGLRQLPFAKLPVALVALLPMSVMEMASLSADALLIGGSIFFIGYVLRCATRSSVSRRDIMILVASAIFLLTVKPGYAALSLLLFLLLPRQFSSRVAYAVTVGGSIVGGGLLTLAIMKIAPDGSDFAAQFLGKDNQVDQVAQLRYVVSHPLGFVGAVGRTLNAQGIFFLRQSVAAYAWGQRNVGDLVVLIAAVGVASVLAAAERAQLAWWRRVIVVGVALLTALVAALGLYMGWTPVGAAQVSGLQGRYFVPCYVLAFVALAGFPFRRRWVVPVVVGAVILVLFVVNLHTLVTYYY